MWIVISWRVAHVSPRSWPGASKTPVILVSSTPKRTWATQLIGGPACTHQAHSLLNAFAHKILPPSMPSSSPPVPTLHNLQGLF